MIKLLGVATLSLVGLGLFAWLTAPKAGADNLSSRLPSEDGLWAPLTNKTALSVSGWQAPPKGAHQLFRLNRKSLARQLAAAPMERTSELRLSPAIVSLPMPDGSFKRFHVEESPVMDAALVAQYPEIKSYRGQGVDDGTMTVRFDSTPLGLHALVIFADQPAVNIQPPDRKDLTTYVSYFDERVLFKCGVDGESKMAPAVAHAAVPRASVGSSLRTERIAIAATWEFCNTIGNDTVSGTVAAINSYMNAVNALYERELSTHMNLVNAPNVIYSSDNNVCGAGNNQPCNANNDPYTNANESTMLGEVAPDLGNKVGAANFDLGHVLGTGGAGIAGLGVVCRNDNSNGGPLKAVGASRIFGPPGNSSASGLFAHEVGHQHGASHTFNGTNSFCGPARSAATAWEPGSGITLMSYGGICTTDNLVNSTAMRLHNGSFNEMVTYLTANGSCAVLSATGNNIPTVDAGTAYTIPKLTPFTLTATGTDADSSDVPNLTFVWEQFDAGGANFANPPYGDQAGDPNTTTRPLFRPFAPTTDKSRIFPSLTYILNNANIPPATVGGLQTGESLPAVARTMNFRCTVRDQRGGVSDSSVALTVAGTAGPFAVTYPNGGQNISGTQTVTWNVNGTDIAPVSVANVKVTMSTDGGTTFPIVLAASTPNNGSATVTLPNGILSSNARVKVEAVGNIFFDISDANFTIMPGDGCLAVSNFSPQAGPIGTVVTITGANFTGVTAVKFNGTAATNFTVNSPTQISATVPTGAAGGAIVLSKPGCADLNAGSFSLCPTGPTALSIDDGTVESASGGTNGAYYVNRLTPASYPATVTQVSIYFNAFQQVPQGTAINVVVGANTGGTTNIDNTSFQSTAGAVGAQPGFTTYTLPAPVTISSGDFIVGFQIPTDPGFAIAVDTDNPASRSYRSSNGTNFTLVTDGNFMTRAAQVYTNCSAGSGVTVTPKILSITKAANGHIILQCLGTPSQVNTLAVSANLNPPGFSAINPAPSAADATGAFTYDDAGAVGLPQRYYRVTIP